RSRFRSRQMRYGSSPVARAKGTCPLGSISKDEVLSTECPLQFIDAKYLHVVAPSMTRLRRGARVGPRRTVYSRGGSDTEVRWTSAPIRATASLSAGGHGSGG